MKKIKRDLCGVTYRERCTWYLLPGVVVFGLVSGIFAMTPLQHWLGAGWYWTVVTWVGGCLAVLAGLLGRYHLYLTAEMAGPWIIVDHSVRPSSFYRTAMYAPIGKGYSGYLCLPACVEPGKVYYFLDEVRQATRALQEAHAVLRVPQALRPFNDAEWCALVQDIAWLDKGYTPAFGILPYYE